MISLTNLFLNSAYSYYDTILFPIGLILIPSLTVVLVMLAKAKEGQSFPKPEWRGSFMITMLLSVLALLLYFICQDTGNLTLSLRSYFIESESMTGFILLSVLFHIVAWIFLISYLIYYLRKKKTK